jgi:hypothetical protein
VYIYPFCLLRVVGHGAWAMDSMVRDPSARDHFKFKLITHRRKMELEICSVRGERHAVGQGGCTAFAFYF